MSFLCIVKRPDSIENRINELKLDPEKASRNKTFELFLYFETSNIELSGASLKPLFDAIGCYSPNITRFELEVTSIPQSSFNSVIEQFALYLRTYHHHHRFHLPQNNDDSNENNRPIWI